MRIGILAIDGNTITNNGTVTADLGIGILAMDNNTIVNNGIVDATNGADGIFAGANAVITNNGTVIGGVIGIEGTDDAQIVINNGTVTGVSGTAISLYGGDDEVVVLFGSKINGTIDGGADIDTITFDIQAYADDASNAQAIADAIAAQCPDASNCTVVVNGFSYVVVNFEGPAGTRIILITRARLHSTTICDGDVKVMKPNGASYYDVFSGFSNDLPNGFWVGRVDAAQMPDMMNFQDKGPHNPGWYVGVTPAEDDLIVLQVRDAAGGAIGKPCTVPK